MNPKFLILPLLALTVLCVPSQKAVAFEALSADGTTRFWTDSEGKFVYKTKSYGSYIYGTVINPKSQGQKTVASFRDFNATSREVCGGRIEFRDIGEGKISAKWTVLESLHRSPTFASKNPTRCKMIGKTFDLTLPNVIDSSFSSGEYQYQNSSPSFQPNAKMFIRATVYMDSERNNAAFSLAEGTQVRVIAERPSGSSINYLIETSDGRRGWVASYVLEY
jgi:hypothetical protein